jgi:hypothetical protein
LNYADKTAMTIGYRSHGLEDNRRTVAKGLTDTLPVVEHFDALINLTP